MEHGFQEMLQGQSWASSDDNGDNYDLEISIQEEEEMEGLSPLFALP